MTSPLPLRAPVDHQPRSRSVLHLGEDETGSVFQALGSETARALYASLSREPATASDLADRLDTSLQNVQYHLENLSNADLLEEVDTWYSERGCEMTVYGVTAEDLVIRNATEEPPSPGGSVAAAD